MPRRPAVWVSAYAALALAGVVVGLVAGGSSSASAPAGGTATER